MQPPAPLHICVFCGATPGISEESTKACAELGELIADRGHELIYGTGGTGLMGELAVSVARRNGRIVGVIPAFLRQRERAELLPHQDLILTDDLFQRKRIMIEHADCYIGLPGGYGTLDEIMEVISLAALGIHRKPIVLVNVDGAWDQFLRLLADLLRQGFASAGVGQLFEVADSPGEAIELAEQRYVPAVRRSPDYV